MHSENSKAALVYICVVVFHADASEVGRNKGEFDTAVVG